MSQEIVNITYVNSIDQPVLVKFSEQGLRGFSGYSGVSAWSGASGWSGESGYSGVSGWSGWSGEVGTSGYSGEVGASGASGMSGDSTSGYSGVTGADGASGLSGFSGTPVSTTGTSGYVPYFTSPTDITNSLLYYDSVNQRIGVGITVPTAQLHLVKADSSALTDFLINPTLKTSGNLIDAQVGSVSKFYVTNVGNAFFTGGILNSQSGAGLFVGTLNISVPTRAALTTASGTFHNASGIVYGLAITPTINQTGTAAMTDLLINRTQTAVGSGTQRLIEAQVGGVAKFGVGADGYLYNLLGIDTSTALYFGTRTNSIDLVCGGAANDADITARHFVALTNISGNRALFKIEANYNQATGTAANTDLLINRTQTAVGSGAQLLIDAQVGSVSKFSVRNDGDVFCSDVFLTTAQLYYGLTGRSPGYIYAGDKSATSGNSLTLVPMDAFINTTGTRAIFAITPTYNQATGDAANTDFLINRTQTAVGSGAQYLFDAQVGGVSKFYIRNDGLIQTTNTVYASALATNTISPAASPNTITIGGSNKTAAIGIDDIAMATGTISNSSGTFVGVVIKPTYNQSGTAGATDLLINRTQTAVGSGAQLLIDAQVGSVSKAKITNLGEINSTIINNSDSDTDEVDSVTWAGGYGLLTACETTGSTTAVWRLEGTTLVTVSLNAAWTATKDNAGTYNVYFESGAIKLQNKVGDNKIVKLGFYGM